MGDPNKENNWYNKRVRVDSDLESPEEKRVDSEGSILNSPEAKRMRTATDLQEFDPAEWIFNWPEANRIPGDILDILDEPDSVADRDSAIEDLDSVIRSFEEEILHPTTQQESASQVVSSECGESQPDLGYLLDASDDELGLPPTISPSGDSRQNGALDVSTVAPEAVGLSEVLGFEDEFPSYDSFGFGIGEETQEGNNAEFVNVGGLFDFDFSEFLCRPESESLHSL